VSTNPLNRPIVRQWLRWFRVVSIIGGLLGSILKIFLLIIEWHSRG
jgi:hypothetical protein